MPRGAKATEKLKRYQHELDLARRFREDEGLDDLWQRLIDLYRGKQFTGLTEEDRIAINIAFSTINVIYPAISVNTPKISVLANEEENEDRSLFAEAILNYWWKHHDFHLPFRLASKDFLMLGHGWVKIGWRSIEGQRALSDTEWQKEFADKAMERDAAAQQDPSMAASLPTYEEIAESIVDTKTVVLEDRPFMERVSPFDVYVDPEASSLQDARWIAQRIVRPLEEVRKDKRYRQSARLNVQGTALGSIELDRRQRKEMGDDALRVVVWEHYDLVNGRLCIFADGGSDFLVEPMDMPYAMGHPFVMVRNYEVPGQFYPIGDLEMLEPLQLELNATRSALMNNRKTYARKYLYRASGFGEKGVAALRSNVDGTVVPVEDENRPFSDLISPMPHTPLSGDIYNLSDIIMGDAREVSGISEYQRGVSPSVRRTATEAAMIQDATNARSADKLGTIEAFIREVARKQLQVAQQFLTGEQVARVTGSQGKTIWLPYTRDDIVGEFDFTVEAGSTQPTNDQQRRQDAMALVSALGPFIEMQIVDPIAVAKHVLQEGFKVRSFDKFITPDAMKQLEMRKQMQEQQLMQQTLQNQQAQAQQAQQFAQDPAAQGGFGVDAPQMDPRALLMAQQGDTSMSGAA